MKVHHSGILTNNLSATLIYFRKLNYLQITNEISCNFQKVKIIFLKKKNHRRLLEIVKFYRNNKELKNFYKKRVPKGKLFFKYHDCFFVKKNYEKTIKKYLNKKDFKLIVKNKSSVFGKVSFFKKKNRKNLIEIVSQPRKKFIDLLD